MEEGKLEMRFKAKEEMVCELCNLIIEEGDIYFIGEVKVAGIIFDEYVVCENCSEKRTLP